LKLNIFEVEETRFEDINNHWLKSQRKLGLI